MTHLLTVFFQPILRLWTGHTCTIRKCENSRAISSSISTLLIEHLCFTCCHRFILRNYIAQNAIEAAEKGDFSEVHRVLKVLQKPYSEDVDLEDLKPQPGAAATDGKRCPLLTVMHRYFEVLHSPTLIPPFISVRGSWKHATTSFIICISLFAWEISIDYKHLVKTGKFHFNTVSIGSDDHLMKVSWLQTCNLES